MFCCSIAGWIISLPLLGAFSSLADRRLDTWLAVAAAFGFEPGDGTRAIQERHGMPMPS